MRRIAAVIPRILRRLPPAISQRVYYRVFNHRQSWFSECFDRVELRYGKGYFMERLVVGDVISGQIALCGFYEPDLSMEIQRLATQPVSSTEDQRRLLVDVGANMGYFSLLWLAGNAVNRVVAIEASPANCDRIRRNLVVNCLEDRAQLLACAAGDSERVVQFSLGPEDQTGWGGLERPGQVGSVGRMINVPMRRLDDVFSGNEQIEVLKIDVEGSDSLVLEGAERILREKRVKWIFCEQNLIRMRRLGVDEKRAEKLLTSCGYHVRISGSPASSLVAYRP